MSLPSPRALRHTLPWCRVPNWVILVALTACGGSLPARVTQSSASNALDLDTPTESPLDMSTSAELGGLNESEAEQSFRASVDGLQACIKDGVERLAFMGGSIELAVKVDAARHPAHVWAAQSSLGERGTEKCMFDALRSVGWPAPIGGPFGIARNSFEFEPQRGVPAPAVWDAERVATTLSEVEGTLSTCRGSEPGVLLITLYIGEGGTALAGGAASEEPQDEAAVDCVVDALLAAVYPPPERSPTKVRFRL